ncbi:MAG: c-type cytochrome [Sulfurospirillum sp.]
MKEKLLFILILSSALLCADGAAIYSKCAKCHGEDGKHKAFEKSARIAGWKVKQTVAILNIFKNMSKYDKFARVMNRQVSKLSDKEIEAVAKYISKLK